MESAVVCGEVVVCLRRFWKLFLVLEIKCDVWGGCGVLRKSFRKFCCVWGGCFVI